jgi:hypothetical protein
MLCCFIDSIRLCTHGPLSDQTHSCWQLPGHWVVWNISDETLSDWVKGSKRPSGLAVNQQLLVWPLSGRRSGRRVRLLQNFDIYIYHTAE